MFNFRLSLIIIALIFPFNANSIFHKSLSPSDTSCEELGDHVEGMELSNLFGASMEILKVKNTKEVSRTFEKLICQGNAKLSNGTEGVYEMELYKEDGDIWYKVSPKLDFDFGYDTSTDQEEIADLKLNYEQQISDLKLKYEQEIRELKKELLEIKKLSVSKLQCGSYTFTSLIGNCDKGYGEIIFNDNDKYIGEILDGQGTGIGKYVFEDGAYYVGEFIDFDFNGQGTLILSNGTQLIGYFENGSYQFGSQIDSGGITISDSNIDGISCGIIYFNGGHYKGCFKNGVWNDEKAELHAITGLAYYGAFVDGKLTDENAIIKYFDSSIKQYTGGVVDFNLEGEGTRYFHNGHYIKGVWTKNILLDGEYNCGINSIKKINSIWQIDNLTEDEIQNGVMNEKLQSICEKD